MLLAFLWLLFLGTVDVPVDGAMSLRAPARPQVGAGTLHTMDDGTTQPPSR